MTKAADLALGKIAAVKTALIEFTDGDDAIAVADAGVVTLLTTAVAKSEGGAVTTNIAQGLCKCWVRYQSASTFVLNDSFNVSSLADGGAGRGVANFINDMGNALFSAPGISNSASIVNQAAATGNVETITINGSNADSDSARTMVSVHGDLA